MSINSFPGRASQESQESIERIKTALITGLERAFIVHETLGQGGEETVEKNQFGDTALKADIECERAIIDYFREIGLSIRIISEEHGVTNLGEHPEYLGILDGLDGSCVYKRERGVGRYGTMFAVLKGIDPTYADYVSCGIMEHTTHRLFIASKGGGAFVKSGNNLTPIRASGRTTFDSGVRIYVDEGFESNKERYSKRLQGFPYQYLGSSAVYYADVASGAADLALECTRKGNLEIAVAYGLETEAGAVMVNLDDNDIGGRKYLEYGQKTMLPIITAATPELARAALAHIRSEE